MIKPTLILLLISSQVSTATLSSPDVYTPPPPLAAILEPLKPVSFPTLEEAPYKHLPSNTAPQDGPYIGINSSYPILGQCTTLVASMRYVPAGWSDAINWRTRAEQAGWYVGPTPIVGAIGWRGNHVTYVLEVRPTTVLIKEANYDFRGSVRTIERPIGYFTYLY